MIVLEIEIKFGNWIKKKKFNESLKVKSSMSVVYTILLYMKHNHVTKVTKLQFICYYNLKIWILPPLFIDKI